MESFKFEIPKADPGRAAINNRARRIVLVQSQALIDASDLLPAHRHCAGKEASGLAAELTGTMVDSDESDMYMEDKIKNQHYIRSSHVASSLPSCSPGRNELVRSLTAACGVLRFVRVVEPTCPATIEQICAFHDEEYVEALISSDDCNSNPDADDVSEEDLLEFNLVDDAVPFPGLLRHVLWVTGASLAAASELVRGFADVAINWTGGRHHAGRSHASGFCYVNDVVLAVLELQRRFTNIMVLDIDVHHGDGVERAFLYSDKVLTVSFHQQEAGFFPGTGDASEHGKGKGAGFNTNVPLMRGTSGEEFLSKFNGCIAVEAARFKPDAVVLVCGADALKKDPRGGLNLEPDDLCAAVAQVKQLTMVKDLPLLALGGGGYNFTEAARVWTRATAILAECTKHLPSNIPEHSYFELYSKCSWKL